MITETIINLEPFITVSKVAICVIFLGVVAFLLHNGFIFKSFSVHDSGLVDKFLSKYPDVAPEFMTKSFKEQSIENNQEIHELKKEMEDVKDSLVKIVKILEELQKNG